MITDWDDAYANGAYIEGAEVLPGQWDVAAKGYRDDLIEQDRAHLELAYGPDKRQRLDLFRPDGPAKGLCVFVHGGYWIDFDKTSWSHLARGGVENGWTVAVPSYRLAPEVSLTDIAQDIALALDFLSDRVTGPVVLSGHSAGGHLVTRLISENSPLPDAMISRIQTVVSISGLHDLRPLMKTAYKDKLHLTDDIVLTESPALISPVGKSNVFSWVGGLERPEFIRQTLLLAMTWTKSEAVIEPGRHHFNIIDGLADPESPICKTLYQSH